MKSGKNVWVNESGQVVKATPEALPDGEWSPVWAEGRVHGDTYRPYQGSDEWSQMANASMARQANDNFRNR